MKIQEASTRTGLTKRTIRFYAEKGLVFPQTVERNGKEYKEYSEDNLRQLQTAATLRKLLFSIEEIQQMLEKPRDISEIVGNYRKRLEKNVDTQSEILMRLEKLELSRVHTAADLAGGMEVVSREMRLPPRDLAPDFGRFDQETRNEKEQAYFGFLAAGKRRGKRKIIACTALISAVTAVLLFCFISYGAYSHSRYRECFKDRSLQYTYGGKDWILFSEENLEGTVLKNYRLKGDWSVRVSVEEGMGNLIFTDERKGFRKAYRGYVLEEIFVRDELADFASFLDPRNWFGTRTVNLEKRYAVRTQEECERLSKLLKSGNLEEVERNGGTLVQTDGGGFLID